MGYSKKTLWLTAGWAMVALGFIGAFLPIFPTAPFVIAAAFCFKNGSPRLHQWLRNHAALGPPLIDWEDHRVIRKRAKFLAIGFLSVSMGYALFFGEIEGYYRWALATVWLSVVIFIFTRNSLPSLKEDEFAKETNDPDTQL